MINSSGIKYSPAVAKGLSENKLQLTVSVDAGSKKTYEKIKLVKTYEKVCENLANYAAAQNKDKNRVCSKYIIVPGVNDNKDEIEKWLEKTKYLGIKHVSIDVDWQWVQKNMKLLKRERRLYDLIAFTKNISEQENLCLRYDERASIIRKNHNTQTAIFGGTLVSIKD